MNRGLKAVHYQNGVLSFEVSSDHPQARFTDFAEVIRLRAINLISLYTSLLKAIK